MASYTYLIGSLLSLIAWIILYLNRKDLRKQILFMSILVAIQGLILETFLWTNDWWRPATITNTRTGVEDLIFAFSMGGIGASIYEEFFKKKVKPKKENKLPDNSFRIIFLVILLFSGTFPYFVLKYSSFITWLFGSILGTLVILYYRKELLYDSIFTGIIFTLMAFVAYPILNYLEPGFIYSWWQFQNISGIIYLGVPLEDIVWFFTAGALIGPFYEFWFGLQHDNIL